MGTSNLSQDARKDLISKKAYELYVQRGRTPGREMEDWLAAEKLVERDLQSGGSRIETTSSPERSSHATVSPIRSSGAPSKLGGFKRASG